MKYGVKDNIWESIISVFSMDGKMKELYSMVLELKVTINENLKITIENNGEKG